MSRFKPLNRRTFLRGTGALITLPFLEAMLPQKAYAQQAVMPKRLGVFYFPNGTYIDAWYPRTFGTTFDIPTNLAPIAPYKSRVILTRGLGAHGLPQGSHPLCTPYFIGEPLTSLTCPAPFQVRTKTADMILSDHLRQSNPGLIPLITLQTETPDNGAGSCGLHDGVNYFETGMWNYMSWNGPTAAASQMINNPQEVFDRLFSGVGTTPTTDPLLAFRRARGLSVLDAILGQATDLKRKISSDDVQKMDQYFTAIRDVERTLRATSVPTGNTCNPGSRPGSALPFDQLTNVMLDLAVLAMACDKSRIVSQILDNENSNRKMPFLGFGSMDVGCHYLSHFRQADGLGAGQTSDMKIAPYLRVTNWYAERLAYLLGKMSSYQEGERDLLYNSVIIYGSGMGPTGEHHDHTDLPLVIAGELGGTIRTGQAMNLAGTRMANLWLTIMQKFGLNVGSYASSTGTINFG